MIREKSNEMIEKIGAEMKKKPTKKRMTSKKDVTSADDVSHKELEFDHNN